MTAGAKQARSLATRELLVDAAVRLIAERGVLAWDTREVQRAAGQRNNSVVNYHFGSRAVLLQAVVDRCVPTAIDDPADGVTELHIRCLAQFIASDLWSMVLEHRLVVENIGRPGSVGSREWALAIMGDAFLPAVAA